MYSAHGDHPHCVNELLLRGADFTVTNESGDSAYTMVVQNNSHLGESRSLAIIMVDFYLLGILINISFFSSSSH